MSKFAIIGSTKFPDKQFVEKITQQLIDDDPNFILISGGCSGVDTWAFDIAEKNLKITQIYMAHWSKYGKKAGFMRNKQIVDNADMVLAFWDGISRGTKITIDLTIAAGKPLNIYVRR